MNKAAASALAAASLLVLAACAPTRSATQAPPTTASQPPSPASQPAPPPPASTPSQSDTLTVKLGQTVQWDNGLKETIALVGPATSSEYAIPASTPILEFKVTIWNGSATSFDPTLNDIEATAGADGHKVDQVYDSTQGLSGGHLTGIILPGRTASATFGLAMQQPDLPSLVLTVEPSFSYKEAVITGS